MAQKYPSISAETGTYKNSIRELALGIGLNVSDLARVIDTAEVTIYDICNGKRLPGFINERKLERVLGKPIHEMYPNCYENLRINWELIPKDVD
jgi:DNA-binding XRE family transcriptional regulator